MSVNRRAALKGSLTRSIRQLENCLKDEDVDGILCNIGRVESAYTKLVTCHDEFCGTLEDPNDIKVAEEYIAVETERAESILQEAEETIASLKKKMNSDAKRQSDREIRCALTYFGQMAESLKASLEAANKNQGKLSEQQVKALKDDFKSQLDSVRRAHKEFSIRVDSSEYEDQLLQSLVEEVQQFSLQSITNMNARDTRSSVVHAAVPKIEAIPVPTFKGSISLWPSFLEGWKKIVEGYYPREFWSLMLKSKLEGEAADTVSACEDYEEMMAILMKKYGDKRRICESVIEGIRSVRPVSTGDNSAFIKFVDIIEKADTKLRSLDMLQEINNTMSIAEIEKRLPEDIKVDWARKVVKTPLEERDNMYEMLLKFLRDERERVDYLQAADRSAKGPQKKTVTKTAVSQATSGRKTDIEETCEVCRVEMHPIWTCEKFRKMDMKDRRDKVATLRLCFKCLKRNHMAKECKHPNPKLCKHCKRHNYMLPCPGSAGSKSGKKTLTQELEEAKKRVEKLTEQMNKTQSGQARGGGKGSEQSASSKTNHTTMSSCTGPEENDNVILMLQYGFTSDGKKVGIMWDNASDTNYCTHELAKRLQLRGEPYTLQVDGLGTMKSTIETYRYVLRLKTDENIVNFVAYGLDDITSVPSPASTDTLASLFECYPKNIFERPRKCDILISQANANIMPSKEDVVGNLVLWKGPMGYVVGGSHECLKEDAEVHVKSSSTHLALSLFTKARKENIVVGPGDLMSSEETGCFRCANTTVAQAAELIDWFKYDQIGAACIPKCGSCRCGQCPPGGKNMTLQEEREFAVMEECLTYQPHGDKHSPHPHWDTKYPYLVDPSRLPNNYASVKGVLNSTLKRLDRDPKWKEVYSNQIDEMVSRGAARKLSDEEMKSWTGPVWHIAHQIAPNPQSKTTPCRLVWNSSQPCQGVSLNSILMKGPDFLNAISNVLLRFRSGVHAIVGDVAKMYNSVFLEDKEMHLHRFLWPNPETKEVDTYVIQRLNIGDRPAACLAMLAMKLTAQLAGKKYQDRAAETIMRSSYVDDILDSTDSKDDAISLQNNVEQILNDGGFRIKAWIHSGDSLSHEADVHLPNAIKAEESRALGLGYDVKNDKLYITSSVNFSKKMQKMHLGPNLQESEVEKEVPEVLTKRIVLTQMMKIFDPVGLASPFKMRGAILFRKTWQMCVTSEGKPKDWDDAIPSNLRAEWIEYFKLMTTLPSVKFDRAVAVPNGKNPMLITFSDGSDQAYGAVSYVRWEVDGKAEVRLIESKGKLCPLALKGDTVKSEMCGAVFAVRIRKTLEANCPFNFVKCFHFLDSMTVLGAIGKEAYGFATFFANRVGEIRNSSSHEDWWWIPSKENPADSITRGASPSFLENSSWKHGPPWLCDDPSTWPISHKNSPEGEQGVVAIMRKAFTNVSVSSEIKEQKLASLKEDICIEKYSSLRKAVRVVSTLKILAKAWCNREKPIEMKDGKPSMSLTVSDLNEASLLLHQMAQLELKEENLKSLVLRHDQEKELLVTCGRIGADRSEDYEVPLLPPCHLAKLVALEEHSRHHGGVDSTFTHLRSRAWVLQGRRLVKKLVYECVVCRKYRKQRLCQVMGDLPDCRMQPNPAFSYTAVDLFGPIFVRGETNKRSRMKIWGCIFSCLSSRAIHVDVARDYGTEGFLLAYRRFQSIRGSPIKMYSDEGTNFTGASRELKAYRQTLNDEKIAAYGAHLGTDWIFHPPDTPHANGAVESMVKLVKKALQNSVGGTVLSFSEMQTALFEAAELVNERPIGITSRDDNNLNYLCPNQLLLGRSSATVPPGNYETEKNTMKRYRMVQDTIDRFWREWTKLSFPHVIVRRKWHVEYRNLCKNDIVLISSESRGENRLGIVTNVYPDQRGRVRKVELRVAGSRGSASTIVRDVRKLVLLLPVEEQV